MGFIYKLIGLAAVGIQVRLPDKWLEAVGKAAAKGVVAGQELIAELREELKD